MGAEEATGSSESLESIGELGALRLSDRRGRESSSESEPFVLSLSVLEHSKDCCDFREREFFESWASSRFTGSRLSGGATCFLFWEAGMIVSSKDSWLDFSTNSSSFAS